MDPTEGATPRQVLDLHAVRTPRLSCIFTPESAGDGTPVLMAASLGLPAVLSPDPAWTAGALETLVDYFLYGPVLEVAIEPFAGLAKAIAELSGRDLWHLYGEVVGRDYYVAADGTVTLSERWLAQGRRFGSLDDGPEVFEASDLWRDLAGRRRRSFVAIDACATCRHHPWCGGFWLAPHVGVDCRPWQGAMDRLVDGWKASHPGVEGPGEP